MKYLAELNEDFYVINILVAEDSSVFPENYIEYSPTGEFRANPAGIGFKYDTNADVFLSPKPYPSWTLDESSFKWVAPIAKPEGPAAWDEENQRWNTPTE